MLAYIIGVIAGAASTAQASVNNTIREKFRSLVFTTMLSFVVSAAIVVITMLCTQGSISIPLGEVAKQPFWIWLGGTCGTTIIMLNVICLPRLGSAWNVTIICFSQVMTGLVVDHFGLFRSPVVSMSLIRIAGAAMVMAGIVLVSREKKPEGKDTEKRTYVASGENNFIYWVLAFLCGVACALQIAFNGALKECAGSAAGATLISMSGGFITTLILAVILFAVKGKPGILDGEGSVKGMISSFRLWMLSGGALACVVVGGNAVVAPIIGTGLVTVMNLIGMMGAGLVIDAAGFLGIEKKPVTASKVIGMILMIAGTAVISL